MLQCLSFNSLTPSPRNLPPPPLSPYSQANSTQEQQTPSSSSSPNVSREFDRAIQGPSYNEIRTMIQTPLQPHHIEIQQQNEDNNEEEEEDEESHHRDILTQVLQPDPNSVRETLANAKPESALTNLVSSYFDHSETTSHLCLTLVRTIHRAREMYNPLSDLLSVLPSDSSSLSQPQCDTAYDLFIQFNLHENPFVFPHFNTLRDSFSDLKHQIQLDRRKCRHRIRLFRNATVGCAVCGVATVSIAIVTAVIVATHASIGFAAMAPFCIPFQKRRKRKAKARLKQLDAAESGTFVVNHVNTIDSLVDRLQTAVEGDKAYVRFALERGRDRHPIQEVIKQLRKTQPIFEQLLKDLEQHIYLCFYTVNKARYALLKEISLHQTV
ncbi:UPF0496 protein At3g19330 isoform X3 [Lathyrus oleraceus]|uniref:Uncharacterized protein n=3 Tax=Pisum sativum TaxID=3888 RepID=A0A9D4XZS8_PEA|nr:UPF0496 protein At3g19330 isoform X3 [Pisum sativum]KAI5427965.1 hypothetical protein KIW84_033108 [Pisum sativum]